MSTSTTMDVVPKLKQVVFINDASIGKYFGSNPVLFGVPENHPNDWLNGKQVHTSAIVKFDGNDTIETLNTIYKVRTWREIEVSN